MKEALKLALEFIERVNKDGWILADFEPQMYEAITAIKEALAPTSTQCEVQLNLDQGPDYERGFVDGMLYQTQTSVDKAVNAMAQPAQEPVAINQHRIPYCADWYDGIPDYHDGHGPYEVRTLYTTPPKRPWVGLTDAEMQVLWDRYAHMEMMRAIEAKLKEKNFD